MSNERKIIHLDMDCFYAAIEVRDAPELRGKPVGVGGSRDRRGVLTTCSYEAREFGIRSAMPTFIALQKCPQLIVVPTRFDVYRRESQRIREIFHAFTETIEPLSLDEAYLDVSHLPYAPAAVAAEIRDRIFDETQLTASAGIAPNKMLAKIASDLNKPNGQFELTPAGVQAFMQALPVRKIWGIGAVSAEKLERRGIKTCGQLQRFSRVELHGMFGKFGLELFELCRGIDDRAVEPHRERKSLSTERTFSENLTTLFECEERLGELHEELLRDLARTREPRRIHKLFVKLKFADFSRTTAECVGEQPDLERFQNLLTQAFHRSGQSIRLMGLGVRFAQIEREDWQLELAFTGTSSVI
ncbi:MAG: polymerase [Chthoniobacter sp.]|jgi:DNA polymerase-4|nr:polymerase [Chthoniobacter sp.]